MTIRSLTPDDRERWQSLLRAYAAFYGTATTHESEAVVWGWIFDEHNDFWCDLAVDTSGNITGFVQYQLMHRSLSGAMVCYLSDLYVDPQSRGHGAGRDMINHVLAFAKKRGIDNVRWLTQEFNYSGRRLYDTYTKKSDFVLYSVPIDIDEPAK